MKSNKLIMLLSVAILLASCAAPSRYGMSKDSQSGIQIGSVVEKAFL